MADTTMDLTGHTPKFGRRLAPGTYLCEIADYDYDPEAKKGHSIRFTFRCIDGGEYDGGTVGATLYVINDEFSGSKGHKDATLDNWFHLLKAVGVNPGKFDAVKTAERLVGRRIGIEVVESDPVGPEKKTYANVSAYIPADALGTSGPSEDTSSDGPDLSDDDEQDDADTEGVDLADVS